jgi:hypothetical protein
LKVIDFATPRAPAPQHPKQNSYTQAACEEQLNEKSSVGESAYMRKEFFFLGARREKNSGRKLKND